MPVTDSTDNVVEGFYGLADAAQAHLEMLMTQYLAALADALMAGEVDGPLDLSIANELRDNLLRSLDLAVVAAQMDGQTADALIDAWMRLHRPR